MRNQQASTDGQSAGAWICLRKQATPHKKRGRYDDMATAHIARPQRRLIEQACFFPQCEVTQVALFGHATAPPDVCLWGKSGKHRFSLSISHFDSKRYNAALIDFVDLALGRASSSPMKSTTVPFATIEDSCNTSQLVIRMHPWDSVLLTFDGSGVPWIP